MTKSIQAFHLHRWRRRMSYLRVLQYTFAAETSIDAFPCDARDNLASSRGVPGGNG
jgi:hypothetical protein